MSTASDSTKDAGQNESEHCGCQLNKFRLQLLCEMASLTKFVLHPCELMNNLNYPVKGTMPCTMLCDAGVDEDDFIACLEGACASVEMPYCMDVGNCLSCESAENRADLVYDPLILGMDFFFKDNEGGKILVNLFGTQLASLVLAIKLTPTLLLNCKEKGNRENSLDWQKQRDIEFVQ